VVYPDCIYYIYIGSLPTLTFQVASRVSCKVRICLLKGSFLTPSSYCIFFTCFSNTTIHTKELVEIQTISMYGNKRLINGRNQSLKISNNTGPIKQGSYVKGSTCMVKKPLLHNIYIHTSRIQITMSQRSTQQIEFILLGKDLKQGTLEIYYYTSATTSSRCKTAMQKNKWDREHKCMTGFQLEFLFVP
jgi:hypothetical protein